MMIDSAGISVSGAAYRTAVSQGIILALNLISVSLACMTGARETDITEL